MIFTALMPIFRPIVPAWRRQQSWSRLCPKFLRAASQNGLADQLGNHQACRGFHRNLTGA
jgi:hypothetical protein